MPRPTGLCRRKGPDCGRHDADIAIWDPNRTARLTQAILHHGADYTPYEGIEITGWPIATMVRGRFVVRDGELVGGKGTAAMSAAAGRWGTARLLSLDALM